MKTLAVLLAMTTMALAQASPPPPADPALVQGALSALQAQRNRALDEAASAEAQLSHAQAQLAELQKQLDALKAATPPAKAK